MQEPLSIRDSVTEIVAAKARHAAAPPLERRRSA